MSEYRPIEGMELEQIEYMHFIHSVMKDNDVLKGRFSSIGKWWRYKGVVKQLGEPVQGSMGNDPAGNAEPYQRPVG